MELLAIIDNFEKLVNKLGKTITAQQQRIKEIEDTIVLISRIVANSATG